MPRPMSLSMVETEQQVPFQRVAIIGLGLIGSSIARAAREAAPSVELRGHDADPEVRLRAAKLELVDVLADDAATAVGGADLVLFCVPIGAMREAAQAVGH